MSGGEAPTVVDFEDQCGVVLAFDSVFAAASELLRDHSRVLASGVGGNRSRLADLALSILPGHSALSAAQRHGLGLALLRHGLAAEVVEMQQLAAGMLAAHAYRDIAHQAIVYSARATIQGIQRDSYEHGRA